METARSRKQKKKGVGGVGWGKVGCGCLVKFLMCTVGH